MKHVLFFLFLWAWSDSTAQPDGYYDTAEGPVGEELRVALSAIIDNHQAQSYASLWNHFQLTDKKSDNSVWDIYSDTPGTFPPYVYFFGTDQCGNYAQEGDCYNREHSIPSSWFNGSDPAYTDLFHLYPTDGYVNGIRSDFPFGEVNNPTYTSQNGSKRGPCVFPGYSGTVFEPIDDYKGDLARTYFYMATRYRSTIPEWNSPMFFGDDLSSWALEMLLLWANADPVDEKEIARNEAIYSIQNNRNPFIDRPEFAEAIWGEEETNPNNVVEAGVDSSIYLNKGVLYHPSFATGSVIRIFDPSGRLVSESSAENGQTTLPLPSAGGWMVIHLMNENRVSTLKWAHH